MMLRHSTMLVLTLLLTGCANVANPVSSMGPPGSLTDRSNPSTGATTTAGGSAELALRQDGKALGQGKVIPLATFEGDLDCSRLVAPFDIGSNVGILTELAKNNALDVASKWLEEYLNVLGKGAGTKRVASEARHQIPLQLRSTAVRMNWLPMSVEVQYGKLLLDRMRDELWSRESVQGMRLYSLADKLLAEVLAAVGEPHGYSFMVHVSNRSGENALALPGGFIVLDDALVRDTKLRNKALFALAHEVAHVLQRHETRAVQARIIDTVSVRGSVVDLVTTIRDLPKNPGPVLGLLMSGKLQFEQHFSSQELHADGCGIRLLSRAVGGRALIPVVQEYANSLVATRPTETSKTTPEAARSLPIGVQNTADALQKTTADLQNLYQFVTRPVDRHPAPKERIDNLRRVVSKLRDEPAQGNPANVQAPAAPLPKKLVVPSTKPAK